MLAATILALTLGQAPKTTLKMGSAAPPFKVEQWVQGSAFKIDGTKPTVVEFWAIWCGPCIQIMPHMSDLADKYKGRVQFVGINTSDRNAPGEERPYSSQHSNRIKKWVSENRKRLRYHVALDDAKHTMNQTWLVAAGETGIPFAFVVKDRRIQWMGHPATLDGALLDQMLKGTYSVAKEQARRQAAAASQKLIGPLALAAQAGDLAKTESAFAKFAKVDPDRGKGAVGPIALYLADANPSACATFLGRRAKDTMKSEPAVLIKIAYAAFPKCGSAKTATTSLLATTGEAALRLPDSKAALGYAQYAMMLSSLGVKDSAKEWLDRAQKKLSASQPASDRPAISKFLADARLVIK